MSDLVEKPRPYTRETHPETFARYGDRYMKKRVHPFFDLVASRIAVMHGGERCEYVELSWKSTDRRVILFADFSDGVRMWIGDDDIERPAWDRWRDRELLTDEQRKAIAAFFSRSG